MALSTSTVTVAVKSPGADSIMCETWTDTPGRDTGRRHVERARTPSGSISPGSIRVRKDWRDRLAAGIDDSKRHGDPAALPCL